VSLRQEHSGAGVAFADSTARTKDAWSYEQQQAVVVAEAASVLRTVQ
jgi:hypothetical protein